MRGDALHHCADLPRHEFEVTVPEVFGLRMRTRGDLEDLLQNLFTFLLDRHAFEDVAAIDVHVVDHAGINLAVGRELDRWRRLATESRPAPGGEAHHIAAAGDL